MDNSIVTLQVSTTDLLSITQLTKEVGLFRTQIHRRLRAGKLIGIRLGGRLYFPKSEVERLKACLAAEREAKAKKNGTG